MLVGILLIILGALILLEQMGIITGGIADYFWPLAVVAVGISLIARSTKKDKP